MRLHQVLLIILIFTQTVLFELISTNLVRRKILKKSNINNQGILTKKGRKIQLTQEGHFVICGIDSLEDDYYGCQSSYEEYVYKTERVSKIEKLKQVSTSTTKGGQINIDFKSMSTAALMDTKPEPVVLMATYNKMKTSDRQAGLFTKRALNIQSDHVNVVSTSTKRIKYTSTKRIKSTSTKLIKSTGSKRIKTTKSSTTPIFATSAETHSPTPANNGVNVGNLSKLTSMLLGIPRRTTLKTKSNTPRCKEVTIKMANRGNSPSNMVNIKSDSWFVDTQPVFTHLFNY